MVVAATVLASQVQEGEAIATATVIISSFTAAALAPFYSTVSDVGNSIANVVSVTTMQASDEAGPARSHAGAGNDGSES